MQGRVCKAPRRKRVKGEKLDIMFLLLSEKMVDRSPGRRVTVPFRCLSMGLRSAWGYHSFDIVQLILLALIL